MLPAPAIVLCIVFLALAAMHVYWAIAGRAGLDGVVPTRDGKPFFQPGKTATLLVAAALLAAALVAVWRGAYLHLGPGWVPRAGIWVLVAVFALRAIGDFRYVGIFKRVRGTRFARNDTWLFAPLCMIISGLAAWLALWY